MLVIRLFRIGKRNQPAFKIVVTDKKNPPRGGRFVEEVGTYNPLTKEKVFKKERIQYWLSQGAQPSDTVYNLLVKEGVLEGKKIPVHKKSKKPVQPASTEVKPQEAPKPQEPSKPADKIKEVEPLSSEPPKEEMKEASPQSIQTLPKEEPKPEEKPGP